MAKAGVASVAGVAAYDVTQRKHAILRTFPVIGHLRFVLESSGGFTAVGGERTTMRTGDFVITPSWAWHDHGPASRHAPARSTTQTATP